MRLLPCGSDVVGEDNLAAEKIVPIESFSQLKVVRIFSDQVNTSGKVKGPACDISKEIDN